MLRLLSVDPLLTLCAVCGRSQGAFMVWPGSHHKCHAFLTTSKACRRNGYSRPNGEKGTNLSGGPDRAPTFAAGMWPALVSCNKNIVPVDAWGPAVRLLMRCRYRSICI